MREIGNAQTVGMRNAPALLSPRLLTDVKWWAKNRHRNNAQAMTKQSMHLTPSQKRWTAATINFLTQDEMRRLLDVIDSKHDYAIFLLAYRHGPARSAKWNSRSTPFSPLNQPQNRPL